MTLDEALLLAWAVASLSFFGVLASAFMARRARRRRLAVQA
jgi:hypothetical protein